MQFRRRRSFAFSKGFLRGLVELHGVSRGFAEFSEFSGFAEFWALKDLKGLAGLYRV